MAMSPRDLEDLRFAKSLLENPSLAAKLANLIGTPLEKGFALLPANWTEVVQDATREALKKALDFALRTLGEKDSRASSDILHKLVVTATGGAGGFFGLPALPVELPVSTVIMLRSIADIARSEGEQLELIEARSYRS